MAFQAARWVPGTPPPVSLHRQLWKTVALKWVLRKAREGIQYVEHAEGHGDGYLLSLIYVNYGQAAYHWVGAASVDLNWLKNEIAPVILFSRMSKTNGYA